jgi:hypothetical protein
MRIYKVKGRFEKSDIDVEVDAVSIRQAKLKGAFMSGFGGKDIKKFMNAKSIRIIRK